MRNQIIGFCILVDICFEAQTLPPFQGLVLLQSLPRGCQRRDRDPEVQVQAL